jgi:hypothetical protein
MRHHPGVSIMNFTSTSPTLLDLRVAACGERARMLSLAGNPISFAPVPTRRRGRFVMQKINLSLAALGVIVAMTILQACAGTARTVCAKPTLTPSDARSATTSVTVKIATATEGAYLRYTLDGSTPTGGPSGNGTEITAARGKIWFTVGSREKTLKAIAYKPGLADSSIAEATYVYESPY